ncbi:hypothetical protein CDCA_CDCA12G3483 [Cyanidium caldarium]|uniref:NADH-ubiquinone oxidoreductase 21kDa subunit N-terminal domain-containing protein n=1 Tax=Cyanidium caldarium TaxID=2771 RepID=A0AAV9IZD4_CYACA|nr:hypothetical protein CDCA_CDCA12G3483 [Cyanidium caldarium]
MAVPLEPPPYPVIDPSPTLGAVLQECRPREYFTVVGATAASAFYGYLVGFPVRIPSTYCATIIGAMGGLCLAYQNACGRLLGYKPPRS